MRRGTIILGFLLSVAVRLGWGTVCRGEYHEEINVKNVLCSDAGVPLATMSDEKTSVACLTDENVKIVCGPDGRLTRLKAFSMVLQRIREFQDRCEGDGGTFSYSDPGFKEPTDESFCPPSRPYAKEGYLEQTLCNFRGSCGPVKVTCECSQLKEAGDTRVYSTPTTRSSTVQEGEPGPDILRQQ